MIVNTRRPKLRKCCSVTKVSIAAMVRLCGGGFGCGARVGVYCVVGWIHDGVVCWIHGGAGGVGCWWCWVRLLILFVGALWHSFLVPVCGSLGGPSTEASRCCAGKWWD